MSDKKILLLFTNHRVAEKLWPIIPLLSKEYTLDLFLVGLHSFDTPWVGDIDERKVKINKYKQYNILFIKSYKNVIFIFYFNKYL